jgi:hypothetical protein
MKRLFSATAAALVLAIGAGAPVARADADSATHYYLSLGDSLALRVDLVLHAFRQPSERDRLRRDR